MEAAAAEEVSTIMKSSPSREQLAQIVKGRRTKRQRPQSPIPFVVSTNSISGTGDGGDQHKSDNVNNHANLLSPASSAEYMDSTEEDEDMANCLILLAQCQSRDSPPKQQQEQQQKQHDDDHIVIQNKFNSRKFLEAPSTGNGKAGYYVYECKTCYRTFPSFQALGGHRASHKKPKAAAAAISNHDRRLSNFIISSDEEEGNFKNVFHQSGHKGNLYSNNNNKSGGKIHECSICGAEFTSGQALGGHMRRHRAPAVGSSSTNTNTTLSLTPMATEQPKKPRNVLSLDLDLNLPAPEDDLRESKLPFASKQQQSKQQQQQQQQQKPALVFSAPTLVDCHY